MHTNLAGAAVLADNVLLLALVDVLSAVGAGPAGQADAPRRPVEVRDALGRRRARVVLAQVGDLGERGC